MHPLVTTDSERNARLASCRPPALVLVVVVVLRSSFANILLSHYLLGLTGLDPPVYNRILQSSSVSQSLYTVYTLLCTKRLYRARYNLPGCHVGRIQLRSSNLIGRYIWTRNVPDVQNYVAKISRHWMLLAFQTTGIPSATQLSEAESETKLQQFQNIPIIIIAIISFKDCYWIDRAENHLGHVTWKKKIIQIILSLLPSKVALH